METTLDLRLETPLLLDFIDPDWPLRPHEVWRLWRWWARALVAGVLFDRGVLHGNRGQHAVKVPTQEEADCIMQIVEKEMGLDMYNSCFQTRFEEVEFGPPREVTLSFKHQYGLQTQEKLWYIDRGSATLTVKHASCDNKTVEATMGALALALRLSCFGDRRGLGCFYVRAYGIYRELFGVELTTLIKRAVATVSAVADRAVSRCRGLQRKEKTSPCGLPPMPALSTCRYDTCVKDSIALAPYMLFSVKGLRREDLYNFFSQHKAGFYEDSRDKEMLETWIIRGVARRPPPLMLKIDGSIAYFNVFISADWPRELKLGWQKIQIGEADILNATARVLTKFINYVKRLGGKVEMMWPWKVEI